MPYIKRHERLAEPPAKAQTPGELNYHFTMIAIRYIEEQGLSYQTINDVMGALDGASKEFYRRVAVPYENKKIRENGDVYPWPLVETLNAES